MIGILLAGAVLASSVGMRWSLKGTASNPKMEEELDNSHENYPVDFFASHQILATSGSMNLLADVYSHF